MPTFGLLLLIVILFYFLGQAADLVVKNLKPLAKTLRLDISFLGFVLGFLTSIPELAIAVNAAINRVPDISYGNLVGGIPAVLGLVLGINIILNRSISTRVARKPILAIALALMLPVVLGVDGVINMTDGALLVLAYGGVLAALYAFGEHPSAGGVSLFFRLHVLRRLGMMLLGSVFVVVIANLIVRFTTDLLAPYDVSPFLVGVLLFGIGTNLPEIIISFRAWRQHNEELSVANLIGSAMANVLILGLLALQLTIVVPVGPSFYASIMLFGLLMVTLVISYRSGGRFTRKEGIILVLVYLLFAASQAMGLLAHS